MPESRTSSKRRRIFLLSLAALAVVAAASFLRARSVDLAAWPAPAPGVSPEGPAREGPLLDAAACRALAARLPDPATAPVDAYRRFQTEGAAALSEADNAAIAARYGEEGGAMDAWVRAFAAGGFRDGFSVGTPADAAVAADLLGRGGEMTVLDALEIASGYGAGERVRRFAESAEGTVRVFTRGAGLVGFAAALPAATLLSREALMSACDPGPFDPECASIAVGSLRAAEDAIAPLADAIRDDWRVHRAAEREFYASMEPGATNGPSGATKWFVRRLGGTEETTLAHVDALFSRLVENAARPYSPDGLAAGLPGWCLGRGRPPWTRDPAGAALARNYLRHAGAAAAIPPSIRLELRAARIAAALRIWRDAHGGEWPDSLDPLLGGDLVPGDLADPFAADGARLRYECEPDGSGWRLWSVGPDQVDGNGAVDAFRAEGADVKSSDFVFTSRERELRRAAAEAPAR